MDLKSVLAPLEIIKHKDIEERPVKSNQNSYIRGFISIMLWKWPDCYQIFCDNCFRNKLIIFKKSGSDPTICS